MAVLPRFFLASPLKPGAQADLPPEEAHHLFHVLRMKPDEEVLLIDGKGGVTRSRLVEVSKKRCRVEAIESKQAGTPSRVSLAFGLPKAPALEFILKRVTEVGVASFQPLITQHSLHPSEWNDSRWRKILVETAKQCETPFFPELLPPLPLAQWLVSRDRARTLLFCDENDREPDKSEIPGACDLLVGAEGGWSADETKLVLASGGRAFGLGRNRLRAETAALVGAALVKRIVGEM